MPMTEADAKLICDLFAQELQEHTKEISSAMRSLTTEIHGHSVALGAVRSDLGSLKVDVEILNRSVRDGYQPSPGLLTRMTIAEASLANLNASIDALSRSRTEGNRFKWSVVATVVSGIIGAIGGAIGILK